MRLLVGAKDYTQIFKEILQCYNVITMEISGDANRQEILAPAVLSLSRSLCKLDCNGRFLRNGELKNLVEQHDLYFIGKGGERIVFSISPASDTVIALDFDPKTGDEAVWVEETQAILNKRFPYNFPKFYHSWPSNEMGQLLAGTVRERIVSSPKTKILYPFDSVSKVCKELDLPVRFDSGPHFVTAANGGEYYLDVAKPKSGNWKDLITIYR